LQALQPAKTFHFLKVVKMLFEAFYLSATGKKFQMSEKESGACSFNV
jgi:hypothetical protein